MGVPGLWSFFKEFGESISLAKLACDHYYKDNRVPKGFRIGIDLLIWSYQMRSSHGGQNPELRTLFFRLCRLGYLGILPIFVLDGSKRPLFKRNRKVPKAIFGLSQVIDLIRLFGFPIWYAPGEAEAECALLLKKSIIDAVMSTDVDSFIFGAQKVISDWSVDDESKTSTLSHVSIFDIETVMKKSNISQAGMLLIALISSGDYDSTGIPNCGIKTAISAAKAGFGDTLLSLIKNRLDLTSWKKDLEKYLSTNHGGHFSTRHSFLKLPEDFPNQDIIQFYINPVVSTDLELKRKLRHVVWKWPINVPKLQKFVSIHFSWSDLPGIKRFVRSFAPCYLVSSLKHTDFSKHAEINCSQKSNSMKKINSTYFTNIKEHLKNIENKDEENGIKILCYRKHVSTGYSLEFRISFCPFKLINIDFTSGKQSNKNDIELNDKNVSNFTQITNKEIDLNEKMEIWILDPYLKDFEKHDIIEWKSKTKNNTFKKKLGYDQLGAIESYLLAPSKNRSILGSLELNQNSLKKQNIIPHSLSLNSTSSLTQKTQISQTYKIKTISKSQSSIPSNSSLIQSTLSTLTQNL
ncbi:hypothetical protein PNEG_01356 [Pneumocystis murina B123]|uniref:XPG-I domain-containing protein n=1 Tax=Pneumocystis murina (strain B123) TaxID=1069680 RepID=M7NTQ5_PNEMU|nr:hypothetical protein PNEG_01356 [Pneumocystis murina B123]EMR10657.1 hypothetical protein PNEG_01356 [Pneumocystis murina B123]